MLKAGLAALAALLAAVVLIATVATVIIAAVITNALDLIPLPIPRPDTATPHTSAPPTPGPTQPCTPTAPRKPAPVPGYGPDQIANANTIVAVGTQLGVPEQGQVVAIAAALAESGLRNLNHGDRDSLGLFQQRPSQGWGRPDQIMNPTYAAAQFYRHLLAIPNWQHLSINDAAQAVQRSATPRIYAQYEQTARNIVNASQHTTCTPPTNPQQPRPNTPAPTPPPQAHQRPENGQPHSARAAVAVTYVKTHIGTPTAGPPATAKGNIHNSDWDCGGLTKAACAAAGITLPKQRKTSTTPAPKYPPHPRHNPATSSTTAPAPHTSPKSDSPSPPQK